ncbi:tetratricopeptide repeat protein [Nonomuraea sp. NPDC050310]|uniref:tetratricopeptide repeat protein n=1 Tax=Nonomuraea sp. NPDC050310 TaxID=3154935 RepID=UPI0033FF6A83
MRRALRNPWVLGAACSIGAGVVPLLVPGGWPVGWRALIAAVVTGLAGASGSYFGVILTRQDQREAARQAVRGLLDPLGTTPAVPSAAAGEEAGGRSVLEVLSAQSCPTPFWGRQAEQQRWHAWCAEDSQADRPGTTVWGLMVVDGPAGCGKTRLALHMARQLEPEWTVGWLKDGMGAALVEAAAAASDMRVLALVDDADARTDLGALLSALAGYAGRVRLRVALITRHGDELGPALATRLPERHAGAVQAMLARQAAQLRLQPLGEVTDLIRWYGAAVGDFATARGVPAPSLSERVAPVRAGQTMVEMLAQAMVTVLQPSAPSASTLPLEQVARVLFEHEARWWKARAADERWALGPVGDVLLGRVIAALALIAPSGQAAGVAVLRRIPELADASEERVRNLLRWAHALYPGRAECRPGPDLLADWFITTHLTAEDQEFAKCLLSGLSEDEASRVLAVLARAAEHYPTARALFEYLLGADPVLLAHHAIYVAMTTGSSSGLDEAAAAALARADLDADTTTFLLQITPADDLPRCTLVLARHRLRHARATGDLADVAEALESLGVAHDRLGHHEQCLAAMKEAVGLLRALAAADPAHQPGLASALDHLGAAYDRLGHHEQFLAAAEEAVGLYRALAAADPAHQPGLADAMDHLGAAHGRLGHHEQGLAAAEEAVGLYRALTAANAANPTHQAGLAHALDNLGTADDRLGHHEQLLAAAEEALVIWHELAERFPGQYRQRYIDKRAELRRVFQSLGLDDKAVRLGEE